MDIRTAPKKVDNSTGFSFLGVDDNELIKINPNDLIKTTSTYAQIKNDISELETALESESENRGSAVRAEKEAREAADNTLQTNINAEVTRAKNAESDLSTNINNEVARAKNAESALSEDLIEEMANVESALNTTISNEVTRAKNAESSLSTTISNEITRAESALNTTISNEVTRAKKAESDLSSSIQTSVSSHNTSTTAHDDIRTLINNLTTRVNAVADSEDVDLDQLSEIVAYIKSNRSLIDNVTTSKVSVSDIIDNLTSTSANKPLSANQGRVLNTSITSLTTKLNNHIDSLSNVENKSSETIRSEITKKNVIDALGYTPGTSSSEPITYTLSKSGSKIILTSSEGTETSVTDSDTNTTYSAGTGIALSGTTFSNAGVRSISSGSTNGTISVNTNGTSAEVAVKGLGSAAYTASSAYAAASHTHEIADVADIQSALDGKVNKKCQYTIGSDDTTPYNYAYLCRIGNSMGYSGLALNLRYNSRYTPETNVSIHIRTDNPSYNGSSIIALSDDSSIDFYYVKTVNDSSIGYDYYDIYVTCGAWNTASYEINQIGSSGDLQFTHKGILVDSLPSGYVKIGKKYADASHTHSYAGSSSAGGSATSAVKLDTSSAGSATQPVYFSGGKPVACTYTLGKSVPSNAVFTDTWRGIQDNLTSTSTTDSLSAKQGKVLNEKFGTTLTSTLSAGSTSLVFTNSVITTSSTIDLYTDTYGVNPTDVSVEAGKMTLTFDTQTKDISVKAVIK